jgi:hypothetical protein
MAFPAENILSADCLIIRWKTDAIAAGEPVRIAPYADKSYGMYAGTAGWASSTVILQGSWDVDNSPPREDTWVTLTESDNTTGISMTANGAGVVLENPIWIRPNRTAGTGAVVNVVLVGKYT